MCKVVSFLIVVSMALFMMQVVLCCYTKVSIQVDEGVTLDNRV